MTTLAYPDAAELVKTDFQRFLEIVAENLWLQHIAADEFFQEEVLEGAQLDKDTLFEEYFEYAAEEPTVGQIFDTVIDDAIEMFGFVITFENRSIDRDDVIRATYQIEDTFTDLAFFFRLTGHHSSYDADEWDSDYRLVKPYFVQQTLFLTDTEHDEQKDQHHFV